MKTALIAIGMSAFSATVAYQAGQWRQHTKDTKVYRRAMDAAIAIMKAKTVQEAMDIMTTYEMDLEQF